MKWFSGIRTAEECKKRYHELVKIYHPDMGGSGIEIKEIISEYKMIWERVKNLHYSEEKQETYTKETDEKPEEFIWIINELFKFKGIVIEMCGSWLWLSGNTLDIKDELKNIGCRWSRGKKKWYYTHDAWKPTTFHKSMQDIRKTYGSKIITPSQNYFIGSRA